MKKLLLSALGALLLGLGAVGLALPVLPTTPFVLLAAACFSAGNPGVYRRLAASPLFGEYIRNRREKSGVSVRAKASSLTFLWGMLGLSAALSRRLWLTALLAAVGAAVTVHILLLKTMRRETDAAPAALSEKNGE